MSGNGLSDRFNAALNYVAWLHRSQPRKGTSIPYISHLMSVAALVLENGGTEDEAIAGLLHDSIEDGQKYHPGGAMGVRADIREKFGEAVLAIVEGCTDADTDPKPLWRVRKEAYVAHLAETSDSVRLVSCADKLHNARCILADYRLYAEELWSRFSLESKGRSGQLWYYQSLVGAFNKHGPKSLAAELARTVDGLVSCIKVNDAPSGQG